MVFYLKTQKTHDILLNIILVRTHTTKRLRHRGREHALYEARILRLNKLEIKKQKGEKFENNVGMTNFLPNSLQLSKKLRIFAPASNGS